MNGGTVSLAGGTICVTAAIMPISEQMMKLWISGLRISIGIGILVGPECGGRKVSEGGVLPL